MTTEHEFDRIARAWLSEGPTRIPDRAVDAALLEVHLTPQRRAWWPARRSTSMHPAIRLAAAAVFVLAVGVVAYNLPRGGQGTIPPPSPTPTVVPSPSPSPTPKTFSLTPATGVPVRVRLGAPDGWTSDSSFVMQKHGGARPDGMAIAVWLVSNIYGEGCQWEGTLADPPIGPTVDDLADALAGLTDREVTGPVDVRIGGYPGRELEMTIPDLPDFLACDEGQFRSWTDPFGSWRFHQGPLEHSRILILDVDGTRLVVFGRSWPGTSPADLAEMNGLLDSMQIESSSPSSTPATTP